MNIKDLKAWIKCKNLSLKTEKLDHLIYVYSPLVFSALCLGFGSFVDKDKLPYVSQTRSRKKNPCPTRTDTCQPAFTFQNVLSLTNDAREFKKEVSKQKISGNLDSPEAGLDAIMQAAVCQVRIRQYLTNI